MNSDNYPRMTDYLPLPQQSIVFDHVARVAYACISPRTDEDAFRDVCKRLRYEARFCLFFCLLAEFDTSSRGFPCPPIRTFSLYRVTVYSLVTT